MSEAGLHDLLWALRVALICLFALAGLSKLRDHAGTQQMLAAFGVPERFAAPGAVALPAMELFAAAALAFSPLIGGCAALALVLTFIAAIGANLALNRRPHCHCFGQVRSAPISARTLAFNIALALAAVALIWGGSMQSDSMTAGWFTEIRSSERIGLGVSVVQIALLALVAILIWEMLKQQGRLLWRLDNLERHLGGVPDLSAQQPSQVGLPVGAAAPDFELVNLLGAHIALRDFHNEERQILLVFSNPHCGPCQNLLPAVKEWRARLAERLIIVLVSEGTVSEHAGHGAAELVLLQRKREVAEAFHAWGTPSAVLLHADGTVASSVAAGAEQIGRLVSSATASMEVFPELQTAPSRGVPQKGVRRAQAAGSEYPRGRDGGRWTLPRADHA